jgi:hypothetical protein
VFVEQPLALPGSAKNLHSMQCCQAENQDQEISKSDHISTKNQTKSRGKFANLGSKSNFFRNLKF